MSVYTVKNGNKSDKRIEHVEFAVRPDAQQLWCAVDYAVKVKGQPNLAPIHAKCLYASGVLTSVRRRSPDNNVKPLIQVEFFKTLQDVECSFAFLPLRYFETHRGSSVDSDLTFYRENSHNPKLIGNAVATRSGSILKFTIKDDSQQYIEEYLIDLEMGGNAIEYCHGGNESAKRSLWEYENVSGVWIPKKYTQMLSPDFRFLNEERVPKNEDATDNIKMVEFFETSVNESIDDTEFASVRLRIRNGELIKNLATNESSNYVMPSPVPVADSHNQEDEVKRPYSVAFVATLFNGILLIVVGLVLTIKKRIRVQ